MSPILEAKNISKAYTDMAEPVWVLRGLNFTLNEGELAGVFGASGSGKSTLLHVIGGIDTPTSGEVFAGGENLQKMRSRELSRFRNEYLGFVFQFYHLLAEFSAIENVMLPVLINGKSKKEAKKLAMDALSQVGLAHRMEHRPAMLSGGEQQRVALARAFVLHPKVILADEPTGNLDHETGEQVFEYLLSLNRQHNIAMILVTHNRELLDRLPKSYELKDGSLSLIADRTNERS